MPEAAEDRQEARRQPPGRAPSKDCPHQVSLLLKLLIMILMLTVPILRKVQLDEEERLCYGLYHKEAAEIVARYARRGGLLRHYAHIFAMMMRLRQLCCHRELIKEMDWVQALANKEELTRQLQGFLAAEGGEEGGAGGEGGGEAGSEEEKQLVTQLREMIRNGVTDDCSICLDDLKSPVITPCAHVFCKVGRAPFSTCLFCPLFFPLSPLAYFAP